MFINKIKGFFIFPLYYTWNGLEGKQCRAIVWEVKYIPRNGFGVL